MENLKFSNQNRSTIVSELQQTEYDLVVIGGGITGAGILLDASSRGMKVALVEKEDFASGTSSKSTKLIHGGLRYLKQFDFALVTEVGTERNIVHKLAPHLVVPEKMLLPLIENGSYGEWMTSIGLKVYDILAKVEGEDKRQMLDKEEAIALEPLLPKDILKGAGYYAEYRTDDARLTLENIKTAISYGATPLNYTAVEDFIYANDKINGVKVTDQVNGVSYSITSKYVINAAGPWVDELRVVNKSKQGKHLLLTKGVHLVFAKDKLPVKQALYFDIPDGRMMFAIPRGKITYVGTTDTIYTENKNEVLTSVEDANYVIDAINNMFPTVSLEKKDIISSWAGLRPLIHEEGKSPSELSRKDETFISDTGLISIAGGKLTGYRKMAERVVDIVVEKLEHNTEKYFKEVHTDAIPLIGGPWEDFNEVEDYIELTNKNLFKIGFNSHASWYLITTYGKQAEQILDIFKTKKGESIQENLILSELEFCIENEMVVTPMDFFIRRTGRLYFDIESISEYLEKVLGVFKTSFDYSLEQINGFRNTLEQEVVKHSEF